MNSASVTSSQYAVQSREPSHTQENASQRSLQDKKNQSIDSHQIPTLDERGNQILNQLLIGKSEKDKGAIKMFLDFSLSVEKTTFPHGKLEITYNRDTSPESILKKLDTKIALQEKNPKGNQELFEIMKRLRELYQSGYSPLDLSV